MMLPAASPRPRTPAAVHGEARGVLLHFPPSIRHAALLLTWRLSVIQASVPASGSSAVFTVTVYGTPGPSAVRLLQTLYQASFVGRMQAAEGCPPSSGRLQQVVVPPQPAGQRAAGRPGQSRDEGNE